MTETDPLPADAVARLRAGLEDHARGALLQPLPPARVDSEALTACRLEAALDVLRHGDFPQALVEAATAYLKDQLRTDGMCQFLPPAGAAAPAEAPALLADIRDTLQRVNGPGAAVREPRKAYPGDVRELLADNTRLAQERDAARADRDAAMTELETVRGQFAAVVAQRDQALRDLRR